MFEREPNIDIVFRNGLKDLEILPPADVWDNIPPVEARKSRSGIILGIAAGIAMLLTLSLLATWYFSNDVHRLTGIMMAAGNQRTQLFNTNQASHAKTPDVQPVPSGVDNATTPEADYLIALATTDGPQASAPVADPERISSPVQEKPLQLLSDDITIIASRGVSEKDDYAGRTLNRVITKPAGQRFFVGASVTPAMEFSLSASDARLAELVSSERARPSYSTGLTFGYRISDRLTINSGIGLASFGQTVTGVNIFAGLSDFYSVKSSYLYSVETSAGPIRAGNTDLFLTDTEDRVGSLVPSNMADPSKYGLTQVGTDIHQVFRYLEMPVLLRYKVIDGRIGLNVAGGLAYGFLVGNSAYTRAGSQLIPVGHTDGVNLHSLSSQLGVGMEYSISPSISVNFEPVLKYYVTPLSDFAGSLNKPYAFGFYSGFFFRF